MFCSLGRSTSILNTTVSKMASSSSSSLSMISKMRNWIRVQQNSDVSESLNSISSFGRTTELLIPEDVRGRVVLYDVFISHRGSDAKKDAIEIHEALKRLGVKSFLDTDGIFKGENLSAVIVEAINSSTVLLVILSKGFAESAWCLEELRLMVEKMEDGNKVFLVPVFLGVEPEDLRDVRHGPFSKAFQMHKKGKEFSSGTIKNWEETLKEVSTLLGPRLSDFKGRKENLFRAVVQVVVKRVRNVDMETAKYPVAVDVKIQELNSLMNYAQSIEEIPCVLGIVGMTGIGKTTVAKQYFNIFRSSFRSACFVDGIRVKAKSSGLASIQKMLLKELALLDVDVRNVDEGIKLLKKRLHGVDVLLVLDDVDDVIQLNALMVHEVLSPASVVLVTTTDSGLLKGFKNIWYYEMTKLDTCQSKELLLLHAMQESTYPELDTLIDEYLDLCDGLPLSLEVIGRSLAGITSKFYWKNTLAKVSDILPSEVKRKFQSYFENLNQVEKEVVIDIACFFDGEVCDLAISFWDASGTPGEKVIDELALKNAVDFNLDRLLIHPQMKIHIIQALVEDDRKDPIHITRLWRPRDVQKALDQNSGLLNLEYLSLVVKGSEKSSLPDLNGIPRSSITWREYENDILSPWPTECFEKMSKLKLLMLEDDCLVGDLGRLPKSILWLRWRFYPYSFLPLELPISNLWVLQLDGGKLSSLWATSDLTKIPLQLRHLHLQGCVSLESLPESIGMLKHLQGIVLKGCEALTSLPNEICNVQFLNYLDLSGCSALEYLPPNIGNLKNLQYLDLSGCVKLLALPNSFLEIVHLVSLDLSDCINLMKIPNSCKALSELQYLNLCGCGLLDLQPQASPNTMEALDLLNDVVEITNLLILKLSIGGYTYLPGSYGKLSLLMVLHIQGPDLVELPWSLGDLSALTDLILDGCLTLQHLVHSIGKLKTLKNLRISSCGLVELPEEIGELCNLEILCIYRCKNLTTLPSSMNNISTLIQFELEGNSSLSISHESFSNLSLLRKLVLDGCKVSDECLSMISKFCQSLTYLKLQGLPISHIKIIEDALPNLVSLSIVSCNSLFEVEVLPKLRVLEIVSCLHLKLVSVPSRIVMWLRELTLNHCPELSVVQFIDMLQHLEKIDTVGCTSLHYIQGLEQVRTLKEMHIFITYWGFHYHGDEWLQKLQTYIYAPAMHFATKTVLNKDEMFKNFQKMDKVSGGSLAFQLPESTVSCAWVMVAFLSHDSYEDWAGSMRTLHEEITEGEESELPTYLLPQRKGNINLMLFDGTKPMSAVHEYRAAELGETIHFSIFTGDFWLCEQLKAGRIFNISSSSPFISLLSGWVRMLSMEEDSSIEAIQSEFFEQLRKEKEAHLRAAAESEEYFFSKLLEQRRSVVKSEDLFLSMLLEQKWGASPTPLEVSEQEQEQEQQQVRNLLDLKIGTRSAEDMKDFQALDVANCRIVRCQFLKKLAIQAEFLAPTWQTEQALFLQDQRESLFPLHLEISRACRSVVDNVIVHYQTISVQVTMRENYDYPVVISHEFVHFLRSGEQEAIQENSSSVLQVVMDHCSYMEHMQQREEEILLREEMRSQIQFFADDDNGIGLFLPDLSDSDDDDDSD